MGVFPIKLLYHRGLQWTLQSLKSKSEISSFLSNHITLGIVTLMFKHHHWIVRQIPLRRTNSSGSSLQFIFLTQFYITWKAASIAKAPFVFIPQYFRFLNIRVKIITLLLLIKRIWHDLISVAAVIKEVLKVSKNLNHGLVVRRLRRRIFSICYMFVLILVTTQWRIFIEICKQSWNYFYNNWILKIKY